VRVTGPPVSGGRKYGYRVEHRADNLAPGKKELLLRNPNKWEQKWETMADFPEEGYGSKRAVLSMMMYL
jgi:hypothetical protein